jgi:hypothetical protein
MGNLGRRLNAQGWWREVLLFALAAALSGFTILREANTHDEGFMLQAALRLLDGQVPYRDFYLNYGPGQPLALAGLDGIFGSSLLSWRILRVVLDATVSVLAYRVALRSCSQPLALLAFVATAAAMAYPPLPHPNPSVLALGLGAILVARRSPVTAGVMGGAAVFFFVPSGLAAAAGAVLASSEWDRPWRAMLRAAVAAGVTVLLLIGPVAIVAGTGRFFSQALGFALEVPGLKRSPFPLTYDGPFDPNEVLSFYLPLLLVVATAAWALLVLRRRPPPWALAPAMLMLAGLAYLLSRPDPFHFIPLAATLPILLAAQAQREIDDGARPLAIVSVVLVALIALIGLDNKRLQAVEPSRLDRIPVDVADGVQERPPEARALGAVVDFVRARVGPGEPVFVANPRHDRLGIGNPLLYVLLDRPNPTGYDGLGLTTQAKVQREIAADLERSRPALMVRWLDPTAPRLRRNAPGSTPGAAILDRYLDRRYSKLRRFGDYVVLERRA